MEGDTVTLQDLYRYQVQGFDEQGQVIGQHLCTGLRPRFLEKLVAGGVELPPSLQTMWATTAPGVGGSPR